MQRNSQTRRTKVVWVQNTINPHLDHLFKNLAKKVDLTVLFCAKREKNRTWSTKVAGFRSKILPSQTIQLEGKDLFTYFINWNIFAELRRLQPDVIMVGGWDSFTYQAAFIYAKLHKIQFVIRSGSTASEPSWRRTLSKPLVKLMVSQADACIAYGTRAKEYLISLGAQAEKVFTSFNTTFLQQYQKTAASAQQFVHTFRQQHYLQNKTVVMYYGQLIERKGVDVLISAFAQLQKSHKNVALLIVGNGKQELSLRQQIADLQLKNVVVAPDPGDAKIGRYYALADIFVLPSREEVWGLVANQALACGLPVIVSDVAGCSADIIIPGKNGYIFRSENVSSLSFFLKKVIRQKKLRQQMSRSAVQMAKLLQPSQVMSPVQDLLRFLAAEKKNAQTMSLSSSKASAPGILSVE